MNTNLAATPTTLAFPPAVAVTAAAASPPPPPPSPPSPPADTVEGTNIAGTAITANRWAFAPVNLQAKAALQMQRQAMTAQKAKMENKKDRQRRWAREKVENFKIAVMKRKGEREINYEQQQELMRQITCLKGEEESDVIACIRDTKQERDTIHFRTVRQFVTCNDFECLKELGQGGYGKVLQVRHKATHQIYAMKVVPKSRLTCKNSRTRQLAERDVLAQITCPYVVRLEYAFQDNEYLYFVLEYLSGGNMLDWMHRKKTFTESATKHYIAELIQAVEAIHEIGFVHRDIKPDNIVLCDRGHLKLLDFGLAKFAPEACKLGHPVSRSGANSSDSTVDSTNSTPMSNDNKNKNNKSFKSRNDNSNQSNQNKENNKNHISSTIDHLTPNSDLLKTCCGTVMYTAPEVLRGEGYSNKVDWWSVGLIMFEALYGGLPFSPNHSSRNLTAEEKYYDTVHRVLDYKNTCPIPYPCSPQPISLEAIDFMRALVCEPEFRLTIEQIRGHEWLKDVDWINLCKTPAPFAGIADRPSRSRSIATTLPEFNAATSSAVDLAWPQYDFSRPAAESKLSFDSLLHHASLKYRRSSPPPKSEW